MAASGLRFAISTGGGTIEHVNLPSGDGLTTIIGPPAINQGQGIALHRASGHMFWCEAGVDAIERCDIDTGLNRTIILFPEPNSCDALSMDIAGHKLYYTAPGATEVARVNFDGSNQEDLVNEVGLESRGIALDINANKVYFTQIAPTNKIRRMNLDGTGLEDVSPSGIGEPRGIEIDVSNQLMYWCEQNSISGDNGRILKANLDGTNSSIITTGDSDGTPIGIALDVDADRIYYTTTRASPPLSMIKHVTFAGLNKTILPNTSGGVTRPDIALLGVTPGLPQISSISLSTSLFIHNIQSISVSGDFFIDGIPLETGSMSLFTFAPPPDIFNSRLLYTVGPLLETGSNDLFLHGHTDTSGSANLFALGHLDSSASGDLYITPHTVDSGSVDLFMNTSGDGTSMMEIRIIHRLTKGGDYDPQLVGAFENSAGSVNIQVWDVVDGQNTEVTIINSGCYSIGNTGRWGWSTEHLPFREERKKYHYYFRMTSDMAEEEFGEFLITVPEGGRWSHTDESSHIGG